MSAAEKKQKQIIADIEPDTRMIYDMVGSENLQDHWDGLIQTAAKDVLRPKDPQLPVRYIIEGNPGTGKTTVSEALANLLAATGRIKGGLGDTVNASELIRGFAGQSVAELQKRLAANKGKVVVIDEVQDLADPENAYGREILNAINQWSEKNKDTALILAGYGSDVNGLNIQDVLRVNPGLDSRFPEAGRISMPSLDVDARVEVLRRAAGKKQGLASDLSDDDLRAIVGDEVADWPQQNARGVLNILQQAQMRQDKRLPANVVNAPFAFEDFVS